MRTDIDNVENNEQSPEPEGSPDDREGTPERSGYTRRGVRKEAHVLPDGLRDGKLKS